MSRSFSPVDLVQLPRIDANGAVALAAAVEAAATSFNDLPATLIETLAQIHADKQTLMTALAKTPGGAMTIKEADRRVDKVAGALHDIGAAWATLAEFIPEGEAARIFMNRIFAEGRRFVNLKVQEEWAVIETKLTTIDREGLQSNVDAFGAGGLLQLLKQVHADYGATIGTTNAVDEAPEIRESKNALLDSLRTYVLQVVGTVKRGKPETGSRADFLLKPLREWESSKPAAQNDDATEPDEGIDGSTDTTSTGSSGG